MGVHLTYKFGLRSDSHQTKLDYLLSLLVDLREIHHYHQTELRIVIGPSYMLHQRLKSPGRNLQAAIFVPEDGITTAPFESKTATFVPCIH